MKAKKQVGLGASVFFFGNFLRVMINFQNQLRKRKKPAWGKQYVWYKIVGPFGNNMGLLMNCFFKFSDVTSLAIASQEGLSIKW
jgi:hypothetical protein